MVGTHKNRDQPIAEHKCFFPPSMGPAVLKQPHFESNRLSRARCEHAFPSIWPKGLLHYQVANGNTRTGLSWFYCNKRTSEACCPRLEGKLPGSRPLSTASKALQTSGSVFVNDKETLGAVRHLNKTTLTHYVT